MFDGGAVVPPTVVVHSRGTTTWLGEQMGRQEEQEAELLFEAEVLRVARALWAKDRPFQGSEMLEGAERDGIFVGPDVVAVVEATVSRRLDKAQKDGDKLKDACDRLSRQHPLKAVKGYFVTRNEPTAEQRQYIARLKSEVVACSFAQLRALLINSREYLNVREKYPFGSARNLATGETTELGKYIPIGLLEATKSGVAKSHRVKDLADRVAAGGTIVLLGDFGAGKSMTIREVHQQLRAAHLKDASKPFPVTLNLRDHQGQKDPDEAIRRHCQTIGFDDSTKLVRAWRAGEIHVLLDGFDEIATSGWLGQAPNLRTVRQRSVELIRKFVDQTPAVAGIFVTGRRHLFDSEREMLSALGLASRKPLVLTTDEFSEGQVAEYLKERGWSGALPEWLPPRPLLLGYLSASGSMDSVVGTKVTVGPAEGWDLLLTLICEREAKIELGLDGGTVRRVLERLATLARGRGDGLGPIRPDDLAGAFEQVCGYAPDEGSYVIIQRMPGLGVLDPVDGSRHFVDAALGDAARAGDVVRYVKSSGSEGVLGEIRGPMATMGELGIGVAEHQAAAERITGVHAASVASQLERLGASSAFVLDVARLAVQLGLSSRMASLTMEDLTIESMRFAEGEADLDSVTFRGCLINTLDLTEFDGSHTLPIFMNCMFEDVLGSGSPEALPKDHFVNCVFEAFDPSSKTTRGILAMPGLSNRQKVLLTILKKVYLQAGSGRRENGLLRGLDSKQKLLVPDTVSALVGQGLLVKGKSGTNVIYTSVRGNAPRVRRLLEAGLSSSDPLLSGAK